MLTMEQRNRLLELARDSIRYGLKHHTALAVNDAEFEPELRAIRATFVTLHLREELQGCIGMLRAKRPLARDVAENAYAAAFDDPRGEALRESDIAALDIHISILSPPEALDVRTEDELVAALRPGIDGLILEDRGERGTLLPSVWASLPDPRDFAQHVKVKAGWLESYWSPTLKAWRYETESFGVE
jgi:uncharacterized protein